jgi:D-alanyl-D-alanine carboxypeptidase
MMDMNGQVLMGHNQDTKRYPASVTKTMTLIMVFDAMHRGELKLTDKITFSAHAASRERTNLGLYTGAKVTVEDGIKALAVHSANDMATAFAEHLAEGSEARFARMMTAKALSMGMKDTVFKNASGLPNAEMVTTAYDMALMSKYLVQNYPNEYHYFSIRSFTYNGKTYRNHNQSLHTYPGVDGIKTGFTRASLFNVAVSAKRPEGRLIVTLFGCPSTPIRTREVESLLNRGFEVLRKRDKTSAIEAPAPALIQMEPATISLNKAYQPRPTAL